MDNLSTNLKIKIGRKGDPRMHRAVLARLDDPNLSLYDALRIGGFHFPVVDKSDTSSKYSLQDPDGALLGQRKNQLSRRLREAKREIELKMKREGNSATSAGEEHSSIHSNHAQYFSDGAISVKKIEEKYEYSGKRATRVATPSICASAANLATLLNSVQNVPTASMIQELSCQSQIHSSVQTYDSSSIFSESTNNMLMAQYQNDLLRQGRCNINSLATAFSPRDTSCILSSSNASTQEAKNGYTQESCPSENSRAEISVTTKAYQSNAELSLNKSKITSTDVYISPLENEVDASETKTGPLKDHNWQKKKIGLNKNADFGETESVCSSRNLHSRHGRTNTKLIEAVELFESNAQNHLNKIMIKAGYSVSEATEANFEYLKLFGLTINSEIERFQQLQDSCHLSCSLSKNGGPPKKRKHEHSSDFKFKKVSLEEMSQETMDTETIASDDIFHSSNNKSHSVQLAKEDCSKFLLLPQKLYGRDVECSILSSSLEKACAGALEAVLISGPVGCGKSRLALSLSELVARKGGYFISGSFDSTQRGKPYSAIQYALNSFCDRILLQDYAYCKKLRNMILDGIGKDIEVLLDIVPKLRLLVGEISDAGEKFYGETLNTCYSVFTKFVKCICSVKHPIVLHIDNMQYADNETFNLIEVLISDTSIKYLLFVGSYSDEIVGNDHPVTSFVKNMKRNISSRQQIEIGSLSRENVNELISNAFRLTPIDAHPLTSLVMKKTKGNALFVCLYIHCLCEENLLYYCDSFKKWTWNEDATHKKNCKAGLQDLLCQKIKALSDSAQMTLKLACFIEAPFTISALHGICNDYDTVRQGITDGLLIPCNTNTHMYQLVHNELKIANLSLLSESQKKNFHYQIGMNLLTNYDFLQDKIFDITHHLNSAADLLIDRNEHVKAARMNLWAGKKAQSVAAYQLAFKYYQVGIKYTNYYDWSEEYELKLNLYNAAFEACCYVNEIKCMNEYMLELSENVTSSIDMVNSFSAQINYLNSNGKYADAFLAGNRFLESIEVQIPSDVGNVILYSMISTEYHKTKRMLLDKSDVGILNMKTMVDKMALATVMILHDIIITCQVINPELIPYIVFKQVQLTMSHGISKYSAPIFSMYGALLCSDFDEFKEGGRFSALSRSLLTTRLEFRAALHIKVNEIIYTRISHWMSHIHHSLKHLLKLSKDALRSYYSKLSVSVRATYLSYFIWSGKSLLLEGNLFQEDINVDDDCIAAICQTYLNLTGKNKYGNPAVLAGEVFNYNEFKRDIKSSPYTSFCILFNTMFLSFIFSDFERAAMIIDEYRHLLPSIRGTFQYTLHCFYDGLISMIMFQQGNKQEKWMSLALDSINTYRKWSKQCSSENFSSKYFLLEAEMANICNDEVKAIEMFTKAVSSAKIYNSLHEEALICERAGIFYLKAGYKEKSKASLNRACEVCEAWGSSPKVQQIHSLHPELNDFIGNPLEQSLYPSSLVFHNESEATIVSELTFDNINGKLNEDR